MALSARGRREHSWEQPSGSLRRGRSPFVFPARFPTGGRREHNWEQRAGVHRKVHFPSAFPAALSAGGRQERVALLDPQGLLK